jgi:D-3-phosphoglycerate dehydrogenase / 2-oxoglutarate reductase
MYKILLTCPPMIGMVDEFKDEFKEANFEVTIPEFTQEMSERELCKIIGDFDGWIIGDDPATRKVLEAGKAGDLKACMRWGVGTDNVDFGAFEEFKIPVENTPGVFGREVADLACHYVTALARGTYAIDKKIRQGEWYKPIGQSLWSARAVIVGFGDIGRNLATRLASHDMDVQFVDPFVSQSDAGSGFKKVIWPYCISDADYLIFTAPLNKHTHHMFSINTLDYAKQGVKIVNVGRGPLIDQAALLEGMRKDLIAAAALDVFELEPFGLDTHSELLKYSDRLIFGSHNGSNTREAVRHVSKICIHKLEEFLKFPDLK